MTATVTGMDIWHASQSSQVKAFAWSLWGTRDGAEDGIQSAIVAALSRKHWFDPAKGKINTWLMMLLKTIVIRERSLGYRRGAHSVPRVFCPGADDIPEVPDLCDPESILIARELDLTAVEAQRAGGARKGVTAFSDADVAFIRASKIKGRTLARRYGVDESTISAVRTRKTFKHLP